MTIFTTEQFKLDLTHLNIKFSEKNSFFETDLIKQRSFPFKIPPERNFIDFFNFISSYNSSESNKAISGSLFQKDKFYDAELMILGHGKSIEAVFYIKIERLLILNQPIKALPWANISAENGMYNFAQDAKTKVYPDTLVNFVEVYDPEKHLDNDWGEYSGFINQCDNGVYLDVFREFYGLTLPRMAELRPFLYIKEIVRFIFSQIGYTVIGDFDTDPYISKALLYHSNSIFYTNKDLKETSVASLTLLEAGSSGVYPLYNLYKHSKTIYSPSSFKIKIKTAATFTYYNEEFKLKCYYNNVIIPGSTFTINGGDLPYSFENEIEFDFNVFENDLGNQFEIRVETTATTKENVQISIETEGTSRPLYNTFISPSDLLLDQTVGEFLEAIKSTFNLSTTINATAQTIAFNFFKPANTNSNVIDLSAFASLEPEVKFNKLLGFSVNFDNGEIVNINKTGNFVTNAIDFEPTEVLLEPLPVVTTVLHPAVQHQNKSSILFFNNDVNAKPFLQDANVIFTRAGFIHKYLRNWYWQLLNSETFETTLYLPIYISSKINAESQLKIFNNYFIVESINRISINNLFEQLAISLFKLKPYQKYTGVIGDGSSGSDDYLPPVIVTTVASFSSVETDTYPGVFNQGNIFNGPRYEASMFANFTTDPQDLPLSFFWEVLTSPDGYAGELFISQNATHSITEFVSFGYTNPNSNFTVRLTVVNTAGLSSTKDLTITT